MRIKVFKVKYFELFSKMALSIVTFTILFIAFSIYLQNVISDSNTLNVSPQNEQMLTTALDDICYFDNKLCGISDVKYVVFDYPYLLGPLLSNPRSFYAEANLVAGQFEIKLSPFVFDDKNALLVFLYHELNHVKLTDFTLFPNGDLKKQCEDHNRIKLATINLPNLMGGTSKYDIRLVNTYLNYPGNKTINCENIK